ncbi:hypothetical protein ACVZCY_06680 [Klebsiella grimontii]
MGISVFKSEVNFDKAPELVKELRITWIAVYDKCPTAAVFILVSVPFIVLYAIYTYGGIRKAERLTDKDVKEAHKKSKKQRRKKK